MPRARIALLALASALLAALAYALAVDRAGNAIHEAVSQHRMISAPELDLEVVTAGDLGAVPRRWWRAARDGRVTLAELKGHPVVINFWTPRCTPCRDEAPALERVAGEAGHGVLVLGVASARSPGAVRDFVDAHDLTFPQALDGSGDTTRRWGVDGVPETFFLSRAGEIVGHVVGIAPAATLKEGVAAAVAGSPAGLRTGGARVAIGR